MGTIAKALQRHKTELAGSVKIAVEAESRTMSTEQKVSVNGQGRPAKGSEESADASTPDRNNEQLPSGEKRPQPAVERNNETTPQAVGKVGERVASHQDKAAVGHEGRSKTVEDSRRKVDPSLVSLVDPDGIEADLFRLLRTRILFPQSGQPPRTILVTSALPEEGKSFVSANLAINMARHVDKHVLLVDCDLRKPSVHAKFGLNGVKGLSEYLSEQVDLPSLLIKSGVEKLTLLPSGAPPRNPSELITSDKMAALIKEVKARYHDRYIILDSPPPIMASETSAIAKWVDGILIVVKYGATSMDLVEELMTHLDREKIIGAVINKFSVREFRRYSYSKYYGYSYSKYAKDARRRST